MRARSEDFAYWFASAVPLAHLSRSARLLADVGAFVDHILASQAASGWLGPANADTDGNGEWARWPVLAGLLHWREATGDARILPAVLAHLAESFRRLSSAGASSDGDGDAAAASAAASGHADADDAADGLAPGWAAVWSKSRSTWYWRHADGQQTTWVKPLASS
jgi:hypothetical protein